MYNNDIDKAFNMAMGTKPHELTVADLVADVNDPIEKAFSDILSKAEKAKAKPEPDPDHIGTTRNGKKVYASKKVEDYKGWGKDDHKDAATFHTDHQNKNKKINDFKKVKNHYLAAAAHTAKSTVMGGGDKLKDNTASTKVEKAFTDVIQKGGGEGSRGGKVIGHTKSGKPIYAHGEPIHNKDYSKQYHLDAAAAHKKASLTAPGQAKSNHTSRAHSHESIAKQTKDKKESTDTLESYHGKDEEKFFEVISKYHQPKDDGESEHTMFKKLNRNPVLKQKLLKELAAKFKEK
jgi:hypothetical protein